MHLQNVHFLVRCDWFSVPRLPPCDHHPGGTPPRPINSVQFSCIFFLGSPVNTGCKKPPTGGFHSGPRKSAQKLVVGRRSLPIGSRVPFQGSEPGKQDKFLSAFQVEAKTYDGFYICFLYLPNLIHTLKLVGLAANGQRNALKRFYGPSFTNCNTKSTHASPTTCATSARQVPAAMAKFQVSSSSSDCRLVKVTVSKGTKWGNACWMRFNETLPPAGGTPLCTKSIR